MKNLGRHKDVAAVFHGRFIGKMSTEGNLNPLDGLQHQQAEFAVKT
jgi:hypothetical protein